MLERIGIPSKSQIKEWKKLSIAKFRRREGLFLAEGGKVVYELLRSGRPVKTLLVREESLERWQELLAGTTANISCFRLTTGEWETVSQDPSPEGVMAVATMVQAVDPAGLLKRGSGPLLLLYRVNNPNNLGALFRTAHWFGFSTVLLSEGSCEATNPKVIRTSMGSFFHLNVIEDTDIARVLSEIRGHFRIIGSEARKGVAPHPCGPETALLMGSESHGLPAPLLAMTDERWRIPGIGGAESLSLPQAAAILMYECVRTGIP